MMKKTKIIMITVIFITIIELILRNVYTKKIKEYKKINEIQYASMDIIMDQKNYNISNLCIRVLYNNVFIPMDEILEILFEKESSFGDYSIITYGTDNYYLDNKNNVITLFYGTESSIDIEIEEIDNKKYIPIYFLASLPKIQIVLDDIYIYSEKDYKTAIDAINENENYHKIVIQEKEQTEVKNSFYEGQEEGAIWREEALKRIEKYRKKYIKFNIINNENNLINKYSLKIKMNDNEFKFGTTVRYKSQSKEYNYNLIKSKKFNAISSENTFKWSWIQDNNYNQAEKLNEYVESKNMYYKAHVLWWDYVYSEQLENEIVGKADELNMETMASVYIRYNNGEITEEQAEEASKRIQEKFENIVFKHIEDEVKKLNQVQEWDVVNEIFENRYFVYYLYERNYLKSDKFLNSNRKYMLNEYSLNNEYMSFIAKCFDLVKRVNNKAKLIYNENQIRTYSGEIIKILNELNKYTFNIDILGVQSHINNKYEVTPQKLYNKIKYIEKNTNINKFAITEYDNYNINKIGKYTQEEKNIKADFIRDMLIMSYSNKSITEFNTWVYNDYEFEKEERKAYEEIVYPWLNYTEEGTAGEDGYSTRLYKGTYTATITLPNGKKKEVEFEVSDDSSDTIDIIIDSKITDVKLKQKPSKTKYYKNDILDLTDGILEVAYDDGTTKEFLMTEVDATVTGFESNKLGVQTVKLEYEGHTIKFDIYVEEKEEVLIAQNIEKIKQNNIEIKNKYQFIFDNESILNKYNLIITNLENLEKDIKSNVINNEKINNTYKSEYDFILAIVNEYNNSKLSISQNNLQQIINDIIDISSKYIDLYKYYVNNDPIENEIIVSKINIAINKYNANLDIEIPLADELIKEVKDIYTNNLDSENVYENYLNKQRILNTCEIIGIMQDKEILRKAQEESTKIKIAYNYDSNIITNQVVKAQVYLPSDKCVIKDNAENKPYKFDMNGSRRITINIRGYEYSYEIKVTNIDKTSPIINGVIDGKLYTNKVTPTITDENLDTIKLTLNGEEVKNFKSGTTLTEEGFYILTAIDKAGNETQTLFQIMENNNQNYIIQDNIIKNISEQTIKSDFDNKLKLGLTYKITRNDEEINETDNIATGDILTTSAGDKYTLIVAGDINKDGKVDLKDLIKIRKSILDDSNLETNEGLAADCNSDGKINLKDLVKIRLMILNRDATK